MRLDRRAFIHLFAAVGAGLALAPGRGLAAARSLVRELPFGKRAASFRVHNEMPWALETLRGGFGIAPITPQSAFFVRNNLPTPSPAIVAHRDDWRFEVTGVNEPGFMTLRELKAMEAHVEASVLQCSGNGRAFFAHQPSGSPWGVGAAGCALWTGVRVADVIERFGGAMDDARFLTARGAEELPDGVDPDQVVVERSVPRTKGLGDCLLAWEMNGEPLPLVHGGPLRLVVPGYFGVNNVKWVKRVAMTPTESGASIQASGYRFRDVGEAGSPQHPSMWRMPVKSWLNGPGGEGEPVPRGPVMLHGVAFSGERGVAMVEVSADDGQSWKPAQFLGPDLGPNAWRSFVLPLELPTGRHRFVSRATDTEGERQPAEAVQNHRGYGHNGWRDPALTLNVVDALPEAAAVPETVTPDMNLNNPPQSSPVTLSARAQDGRAVFLEHTQPACGACHVLSDAGATGRVGPNLDVLRPDEARVRLAVGQGVGAMPAFGAQLSEVEIDALAAYIAEVTR